MILKKKRYIKTLEDVRKSYNIIYSEPTIYLKAADKYYRWIVDLLEPDSGKRLLDIACGGGFLLKEAEKRGLITVGIDISDKAIEIAKRNARHSILAVSSGENLSFKDNLFDYVTNLGSLEHFLNPEQGVQEMTRVLKNNGKAIIMVPNSHSIIHFWRVLTKGTIYGSEEKQEIERLATIKEWQELLEENGLAVNKVLKYNLPPCVFKSSKYYVGYCLVYPFIPLNLSYSFVFICNKKASLIGK